MERIVFSRKDTMVNNFKNSTVQGICAIVAVILGYILVVSGIVWSFQAEGHAGYGLGAILLIAFVLSILSIVLGAKGLKNRKKIRHNLERKAIFWGVILLLLLIGFYAWGLYTYLNK